MDYRESLRGALETTYTDESGRPMLQLIEYGIFRYLLSPDPEPRLISCSAPINGSILISGLHMV